MNFSLRINKHCKEKRNLLQIVLFISVFSWFQVNHCKSSSLDLKNVCYSSLDLVYLQDATCSFHTLWNSIAQKSDELVRLVEKMDPSARMGVATFGDKNLHARILGENRFRFLGKKGDYCLKLHLPLELQYSQTVRNVFFDIASLKNRKGGGGDWDEAVFEAVYRVALANRTGWRQFHSSDEGYVHRIIVVVTDARSHMENDIQRVLGKTLPSFETITSQLQSSHDENFACGKVEYPNVQTVLKYLEKAHISLVFMIVKSESLRNNQAHSPNLPETSTSSSKVVDWYKGLFRSIGANIPVIEIDSRLKNLSEGFASVLDVYKSQMCLKPQPSNAFGACKVDCDYQKNKMIIQKEKINKECNCSENEKLGCVSTPASFDRNCTSKSYLTTETLCMKNKTTHNDVSLISLPASTQGSSLTEVFSTELLKEIKKSVLGRVLYFKSSNITNRGEKNGSSQHTLEKDFYTGQEPFMSNASFHKTYCDSSQNCESQNNGTGVFLRESISNQIPELPGEERNCAGHKCNSTVIHISSNEKNSMECKVEGFASEKEKCRMSEEMSNARKCGVLAGKSNNVTNCAKSEEKDYVMWKVLKWKTADFQPLSPEAESYSRKNDFEKNIHCVESNGTIFQNATEHKETGMQFLEDHQNKSKTMHIAKAITYAARDEYNKTRYSGDSLENEVWLQQNFENKNKSRQTLKEVHLCGTVNGVSSEKEGKIHCRTISGKRLSFKEGEKQSAFTSDLANENNAVAIFSDVQKFTELMLRPIVDDHRQHEHSYKILDIDLFSTRGVIGDLNVIYPQNYDASPYSLKTFEIYRDGFNKVQNETFQSIQQPNSENKNFSQLEGYTGLPCVQQNISSRNNESSCEPITSHEGLETNTKGLPQVHYLTSYEGERFSEFSLSSRVLKKTVVPENTHGQDYSSFITSQNHLAQGRSNSTATIHSESIAKQISVKNTIANVTESCSQHSGISDNLNGGIRTKCLSDSVQKLIFIQSVTNSGQNVLLVNTGDEPGTPDTSGTLEHNGTTPYDLVASTRDVEALTKSSETFSRAKQNCLPRNFTQRCNLHKEDSKNHCTSNQNPAIIEKENALLGVATPGILPCSNQYITSLHDKSSPIDGTNPYISKETTAGRVFQCKLFPTEVAMINCDNSQDAGCRLWYPEVGCEKKKCSETDSFADKLQLNTSETGCISTIPSQSTDSVPQGMSVSEEIVNNSLERQETNSHIKTESFNCSQTLEAENGSNRNVENCITKAAFSSTTRNNSCWLKNVIQNVPASSRVFHLNVSLETNLNERYAMCNIWIVSENRFDGDNKKFTSPLSVSFNPMNEAVTFGNISVDGEFIKNDMYCAGNDLQQNPLQTVKKLAPTLISLEPCKEEPLKSQLAYTKHSKTSIGSQEVVSLLEQPGSYHAIQSTKTYSDKLKSEAKHAENNQKNCSCCYNSCSIDSSTTNQIYESEKLHMNKSKILEEKCNCLNRPQCFCCNSILRIEVNIDLNF